MTLVVASAIGDTPDDLYASIREAAASGADVVEVRLDGPSGLPWDLRGFFSFPLPTLATVRHADDGGRSHADDRARNETLRRALRAGAAWIDVELHNEEAKALVKEAHDLGARVVVSHHALLAALDVDEMMKTLRECRALGADVAKLATRVEEPGDAAALVTVARRAQDEGIPYALMAVNDPFLRLLAPMLGMSLAYGSVPGRAGVAPGQVPIPALKRAHAALGGGSADALTGRLADARGTTRAAFLLGHPVAHSKSPAMQNAAFRAAGIDARYLALDVAPAGLAAALAGLKATNALGCNLTIPHKETSLGLMDELDESAKRAGAVNTVVLRDGRAVGHNTDGLGAVDALREAGVRLPDARVLVLGAGGTGAAIVAALKGQVKELVAANRTAARVASLDVPAVPWDKVPDVLRSVDVLVNATSIGLRGEPFPFRLDRMMPGAAVLDCVYAAGSAETPLLREARERALRTVPGEAMLLHQGARAFTLWTGKPAPVAAMRAALRSASVSASASASTSASASASASTSASPPAQEDHE